METITCPACGAAVPSTRFCAGCGRPLGEAARFQPPTRTSLYPQNAGSAEVVTSPMSTPPSTSTETSFTGRALGEATQELSALPIWNHESASGDDTAAMPGAFLSPSTRVSAEGENRASEDSVPSGAARPGNNRRVGIGAITAGLLAVAVYLVFGVANEAHTMRGDLALSASNTLSPGDGCSGEGGYDDIHNGTQVVLEDESGKTLATGSFGPGTFEGEACVFTFSFQDVPKAAYYRVHSGSRGVLQYSYQEMVNANWSVHLSLGDSAGSD